MAKFCANCGIQQDEKDRVCGNCGTPVARSLSPVAKNITTSSVATNGKSVGKTVKLIAGAIVLVTMLIIIVNIASSFTGYKGTIRKMTKALQEYDIITLDSLASSIGDEVYSAWYGEESVHDVYQDKISEVLDNFEGSVGTIKKIKYEIVDASKLSKHRMEELETALIDSYNIDVSKIDSIMTVDIILTVKGSKKSASYHVSDLYLIKENGSWKLYYGDLLNLFN